MVIEAKVTGNIYSRKRCIRFPTLATSIADRDPAGAIGPHHRRELCKGQDPLCIATHCVGQCSGVLTHFQVEQKENEKINTTTSWYDLRHQT